jgi:hypothetical protein
VAFFFPQNCPSIAQQLIINCCDLLDSPLSDHKSVKAAPTKTSKAPSAFNFTAAEFPAVLVPFVPGVQSASFPAALGVSTLKGFLSDDTGATGIEDILLRVSGTVWQRL